MPSRVIHIRLDDWVLLGCHDVLKMSGKDTTNLPLSTVVRDTITAVIRRMQYDDKIPVYSKEDLMDRIEEFYESDLQLEEIFTPEELFELGEMGPAPVGGTPMVAMSEVSEIAQEVADRIATEGEPTQVSQKVEIGRKKKTKVKKPTFNIFNQDSKSFKEIQIQSPKDRFIEQAATAENDVFVKAVALCYTNLDKDLWGSMEAERIIGDLIASHEV